MIVVSYSVDATNEDGTFGRLINHSKENPNTIPKVIDVQGTPGLYFEAMRDISTGEEILYDYNDRRRNAVDQYPWLIN